MQSAPWPKKSTAIVGGIEDFIDELVATDTLDCDARRGRKQLMEVAKEFKENVDDIVVWTVVDDINVPWWTLQWPYYPPDCDLFIAYEPSTIGSRLIAGLYPPDLGEEYYEKLADAVNFDVNYLEGALLSIRICNSLDNEVMISAKHDIFLERWAYTAISTVLKVVVDVVSIPPEEDTCTLFPATHIDISADIMVQAPGDKPRLLQDILHTDKNTTHRVLMDPVRAFMKTHFPDQEML